MTGSDGSDGTDGNAPWWASGRDPDEGLDPDEDPLGAHRAARGAGGDEPPDAPHWLGDALDLVARFAADASRRFSPGTGDADAPSWRIAPPHDSGEVCDACPVCLGLRALRQVRPDVISHLSEAAHHLSLALKGFADAQADATGGPDTFEHIDIDVE
jgi:hypothetical protein